MVEVVVRLVGGWFFVKFNDWSEPINLDIMNMIDSEDMIPFMISLRRIFINEFNTKK